MSILIDGFLPNSNIVPIHVAEAIDGTPGGLTGTLPGNLIYEADGLNIAIQFDGTEAEDVVAKFQIGVDGVLQPGGIYRIWLSALESGSGSSWLTHSINAAAFGSGGGSGPTIAPNYGTFWSGSNTLTSAYKWFSITQHLQTDDDDSEPNSVAFWTYRHEPGLATKKLQLDAVIVEEIAGA